MSASAVTRAERDKLEQWIQYLNLDETAAFCRTHDLPLYIHVERPNGRLRRTSDRDRKDIVLRRMLDFALDGKRSGPTIYSQHVVSDAPLPVPLHGEVRVHYGQYDKKNPDLIDALRTLSGEAFRNGMIARLVLRHFWTDGVAPTLIELAEAWERAVKAHVEPRPEGAYISDLARGQAGEGWKQKRIETAAKALDVLDRLTTGSCPDRLAP